MPKYRRIKIIDEGKAKSYSQTSVVTVVGGSPGTTPPISGGDTFHERGMGDEQYFGRGALLTRDLKVGDTEMFLSDNVFTVSGTYIGFWERDELVEIGSVDSYAGQYDEEHRYIIARAVRGTTEGEYSAGKTFVFNAQRYIKHDTSLVQPSTTYYKDVAEPMMVTGYLARVTQAFKDKFYPWLAWGVYGVAADVLRIADRADIATLEVLESASIRSTLNVVSDPDNAGVVAGITPVGNGFAVLDEQGYPWVQMVSVMDGDTEELHFSVGDTIRYSLSTGELELGGSRVVLSGTENGMIVTSPLLEEHYLTVGPSVALADGRFFAPFKVGTVLTQTLEQTVSSDSDVHFISGTPTNILSLVPTVDFPIGSTIKYSIHLSEEVGHESDFATILFVNGNEQDRRTVQINKASASVEGEFKTNTLLSLGDQVRIQVLYTEGDPAADGWSRASLVSNTLSVKHE